MTTEYRAPMRAHPGAHAHSRIRLRAEVDGKLFCADLLTLARQNAFIWIPANHGPGRTRCPMLYVIIADGTFDQVCETQAIAKREKRDLEKMGCVVRIVKVGSWAEADAIQTKMEQ